VTQPRQGAPNTRSYDQPRPEEAAGIPTPAAQPDRPTTSKLGPADEGRAQDESTAQERPLRTDSHGIAPATEVPISLSFLETPPPRPTIEPSGGFRPGEQVDHFEIVSLVGKGGMGCVYKAFDRDLGRTVAIKTLHGIDQHQPHTLARFRREAQAASRVVHPNLVIIYAYGTHGDTPYIVMEYLSGCSLAAEIAEGPLSIERTADILVAACAGVYAAHGANVVHRDLKPGNIFLARTPMGETTKILDFGISRVGDDDANLTATGNIVGTMYYLAPEQAAGREIDARVDQYALGVILYECLTGARPFSGSAPYAIMRNIVEGIFLPPSRLRPDMPRGLEAVILRAMSRVPDNRFARVRDLGLALIPYMSTQGRQQWSYHFTAPEAEMPIAPSAVVPTPSGAGVWPAPTDIAPAQPPTRALAPTKILPPGEPEPWQAVPTRTNADSRPQPVSGLGASGTSPILRRGHGVALAVAAALVVLLALAAWALRPPVVRNTARPAPLSAAPVEAAPPPAVPPTPVAPVPDLPAASLTRGSQPTAGPAKPAPRKPKRTPRSSVKFTPEGVPII